jgi:hypothetical protein
MSPIRYGAALIGAYATIMAVGAPPAPAKSVTLHFFSMQVYARVSNADGLPLPPNSGLAVGDRISTASNDYAGNYKRHARQPTASDHTVCTFTSNNSRTNSFLCDHTIAIGGSMILGDDFVLNFPSKAPTTFKITGGTGTYRQAHGTVVANTVTFFGPPGADLTITLTSIPLRSGDAKGRP